MRVLAILLVCQLLSAAASAQNATIEPIPYGDFEQWVVRNIKESGVLGGKTRTLYEIAPDQTIDGAQVYTNLGGSPWATSNVYCRIMGITKCSNAVFRDERTERGGHCVKMCTVMEKVKAMGLINMSVMVSGSIFLGQMYEPISSTKSPYSKMEMGIPFTRRPDFLTFDYKLYVPEDGKLVYSSGFGSKKTLEGRDYAEVYILLQRRWEDEQGNLHALRVGTGRRRLADTTAGWVDGYRLPVWYGDITGREGYEEYMGLLPEERSYYARNSKGKMVPVVEEGWDEPDAVPTHMLVMASSGCGVAYTGMEGMVLWLDNIALGYE